MMENASSTKESFPGRSKRGGGGSGGVDPYRIHKYVYFERKKRRREPTVTVDEWESAMKRYNKGELV
jgi:hypothetical protein